MRHTAPHARGRSLPRQVAAALAGALAGALAAAALATVGAVALAPPVAASPGDEQALAERYAPVVRLVEQDTECGPGEPFIPTDVDTLLGDDSVALRGPWDTDDLVKIGPTAEDLGKGLTGYHLDFPGDPLAPGCSYEEWARELTLGSRPTTYARVVSEPGRDGLALQYWLYYPFNDFNNKHESDWEMVQVEFAASDAATALGQEEPIRVGYSQHEGVELADWDALKLQHVDGTHPVVHPAAGSHANYFDASLFLGRSGQQGFGCDDTRAPTRDVRPDVVLVPSDAQAVGGELPWLDYTGRWGQRESSFYNGPTGPNTKDQWTAPLSWSDDEGRAVSFAVPASGLYGTQATSFFCATVGTGSNLLRLAMSNPAWFALALTLVAAVLAWLVRRTTWRPSAPLRLARRRSTGQVVAAVWRMYLRRFPLWLGIGIPIAVATLLPGVSQVWLTSTAESVGGSTAHVLLVLVGGSLLALLSPVTLMLGQAAVVHAVREIDEGRPVGPGRAYAAALHRAVPLVLTQAGLAVVVFGALLTVVLTPVGLAVAVLALLIVPVVVLERLSGWKAFRRSAHLVRGHWLKVILLVAVTTLFALGVGPLLGTALILATPLPFAVSNAVSGIVYALLAPLVSLNAVYVYADVLVRDQLEPRLGKGVELPAEVALP